MGLYRDNGKENGIYHSLAGSRSVFGRNAWLTRCCLVFVGRALLAPEIEALCGLPWWSQDPAGKFQDSCCPNCMSFVSTIPILKCAGTVQRRAWRCPWTKTIASILSKSPPEKLSKNCKDSQTLPPTLQGTGAFETLKSLPFVGPPGVGLSPGRGHSTRFRRARCLHDKR